MITTEEALYIIADQVAEFGTVEIPLAEGIGRTLQEEWYADRDLPPYNRVSMDGIAIRYDAFLGGQRVFKIEGVAPAGSPQQTLNNAQACLEVMTGSVLPHYADSVIRYEDLEITDGQAKVMIDKIQRDQNVHAKGKDRQAGNLIVPKFTSISPAEIGIGASLGKHTITVTRMPKVIVISTGDELVEIDQTPKNHQIRKSNVYRLATSLKAYNIHADTAHLQDDPAEIKSKIEAYLKDYDVIMLSGGVSKGKFDFIPEVLDQLGVQKLFHKIAQRPGKPFWFGKYKDSCTVFALPGNPVSSFLCMQRYFLYWLQYSIKGEAPEQAYAILDKNVHFKPDLTYYLEVKIRFTKDGKLLALPKKGNGSGDLVNLMEGDAFIELPRGRDEFKTGEIFPIYMYR